MFLIQILATDFIYNKRTKMKDNLFNFSSNVFIDLQISLYNYFIIILLISFPKGTIALFDFLNKTKLSKDI